MFKCSSNVALRCIVCCWNKYSSDPLKEYDATVHNTNINIITASQHETWTFKAKSSLTFANVTKTILSTF